MRRLLAVLVVMMGFASACGDDGGTATSTDSGDTVPSDTDVTEPSDTAGDGTTDGEGGGSVDCAKVEEALSAAGDISANPTTGSGDDPQAAFEQSRAGLAALGDQVPELSDDIDAALAGMDKLGEALESIGWDQAGLATNPEASLEFAQLLGDADVQGMAVALGNISTWVSTECGG